MSLRCEPLRAEEAAAPRSRAASAVSVAAAGNGICPPTSLENLDAFLDETFRYGLQVSG